MSMANFRPYISSSGDRIILGAHAKGDPLQWLKNFRRFLKYLNFSKVLSNFSTFLNFSQFCWNCHFFFAVLNVLKCYTPPIFSVDPSCSKRSVVKAKICRPTFFTFCKHLWANWNLKQESSRVKLYRNPVTFVLHGYTTHIIFTAGPE